MSERPMLVVMRLANMRRVHPLQDESRVCNRCHHQVGIYPSGQAVLKRDPTTELVCDVCIENEPRSMVERLAPGARDEPFQSVWRKKD